LFRLIPVLVLVSLVGWCTSSRQSQRQGLPAYVELSEVFMTAGLADGNGRVDLDKAAKLAGESGMNRLLYDNASTASLDALKWMVKHGADPKQIGALDKGTLLQRVARKPGLDRLGYFIDELHLDPMQKTPDGVGLIHVAAQAGVDTAALQYLRGKGLTVNAVDPAGRQAIHYAALKSIESLLNAGADLNAVDDGGRTALHWAVEEGRHDVVAELLRLGGSVFAADKAGNTPLHLAALKRSDAIIDTLLAAGAPRAARNADGLTARDLFERHRYRSDNQAERLRRL
jgi:ankyrin repeat protein